MRTIKVLAVSLILLGALDLFLTWLNPVREVNPIMRLLISQSWDLAWAVKLVATALGAMVLFWLTKKYPHKRGLLLVTPVVLMSSVCMVNAINLAF